jgi:hypothetical protein
MSKTDAVSLVKTAWEGVKLFGHGENSNPEKVLKYSVKSRRFGDP